MYPSLSRTSSSSGSEPISATSTTSLNARIRSTLMKWSSSKSKISVISEDQPSRREKIYEPRPVTFGEERSRASTRWPSIFSRKSAHPADAVPDYFNLSSFSLSSDTELWRYMLALQKVYRCYHSARISAAVEELEMGVRVDDMDIRKLSLCKASSFIFWLAYSETQLQDPVWIF